MRGLRFGPRLCAAKAYSVPSESESALDSFVCAYPFRPTGVDFAGVCASAAILLAVTASLLALTRTPAWSQASQAIRLVVPYPPGGGIDVLARILADEIGRTQGQSIVIENRPGAGTEIGTEVVARAVPDGKTLLINNNALVILPHVRKVNYDLRVDLAPICIAASTPTVMVVNSNSPYRSLQDIVRAARAKPGELTYGSAPAGLMNVAFEMLAHQGAFKATFVPFGGTPPALNAVLGEHITIGFVDYPAAAGHIQSGKLRALAVGSRARIPELPDVPTAAESGFKDYEIEVWYALFAPARTPTDVTSRIAGWFKDAALSPAIRGKLAAQGFNPVGQCGAQFAAYLASENDKFARAIRDADIKQ
jgi:tripartite-type tricarboxylate transporter receptor subunit TctC